jgi:hypothetical protein
MSAESRGSPRVTPATLTDEMIRMLQDEAAELTGKFPPATVIALAKPTGRRAEQRRRKDSERYHAARMTCAALWNARADRHGAGR